MARINVETDFFADPRFRLLVRTIGGDEARAIGVCIQAWQLAQTYWVKQKLIPTDIWKKAGFDALVTVDLAEIRDDGVYCRGAEKHFAWYVQRIDAARNAGIKSAQARGAKYGTSAPLVVTPLDRTGTEPGTNVRFGKNAKKPEPETNPLTLTLTPTLTLKENSPNGESQDSAVLARVPFQSFAKAWTDHCGVLTPRTLRMTDGRRNKIRARWGEVSDLAYWAECVRKMAASSFCRESPWATFDWLVKNDTNHVKVHEGKYDDRDPDASGADVWKNFDWGESR